MLRVEDRGQDRYAVSGTPVDAVHMAVNLLFKDCLPGLIISGINRGANLACDINYSGTAAAAREGAILGIPAFAISLETRNEDADFGPAAFYALKLARLVKDHGLAGRTFLNVNVPELASAQIKGVKVTVQGIRSYENIVHVQEDPFGTPVYWLGGLATGGRPVPDSDIEAVEQGFVSVTPLRLDLTKRSELDRLRSILGNGAGPWSKP
jgi:5'-nucleotidase